MPLSGVDGSKFNMKINLYVVSLDEHNVPRVERIQTTKDTKVLNTICLYYRIFFFHYKSCVVLLTSLKKKLLTMFTRCCAPEFALALLLWVIIWAIKKCWPLSDAPLSPRSLHALPCDA